MYFRTKDREFYLLKVFSAAGSTQVPMFFSRDINKAKTSTEEWIERLKKFDNPYHYHNMHERLHSIWPEFSRNIIYVHRFQKYVHKNLMIFKHKNLALISSSDYEDMLENIIEGFIECEKLHEEPGSYDQHYIILQPNATFVVNDISGLVISINKNFEVLVYNKMEKISKLNFFNTHPKDPKVIKSRLRNIVRRLEENLKPEYVDVNPEPPEEFIKYYHSSYQHHLYSMKLDLTENLIKTIKINKVFTSEKFQEIIKKLNEIYSRGLYGEYYIRYQKTKIKEFLEKK